MHYQLLITLASSAESDSEDVRRQAYDLLASDDSFCGEGGRFGTPLCDWFVIGGRWSGLLGETAIGAAFKDAVRVRFPELVQEFYPQSLLDQQAAEFEALWQSHGGTGPSPYKRDSYEHLGYPDDAMLLTQGLYDALLSEYAGCSEGGEGFADLDGEALQPDFVGRKWLVVVDYHN